jgi:hypothetical protein
MMKRAMFGIVFTSTLGWAALAHAQIPVGTWERTDAGGKGMIMTATKCCNGGLRLVYSIPGAQGQPATMLTVDSPMDGTEVPALLAGGKPSGETMAIKRLDDRHYEGVVKMDGKPFGTAKSTLSADGKTITTEGVYGTGAQTQKVIETWIRK